MIKDSGTEYRIVIVASVRTVLQRKWRRVVQSAIFANVVGGSLLHHPQDHLM